MPQPNRRRKTKQPGPSPQGSGPSFLAAARIRRPFGIRGELLLDMLVRRPQILAPQAQIYIGEQAAPHVVVALRRHGEEYLLRLAGIGDRNAAESLRGLTIYLRAEEQEPLPEGVFYIHQIEGLRVVTEDGKELGKVSEILKTGANDVYVVVSDRGEVLLPAIPPVIREVRVEEGTMVVRLLDGLLDGPGDKIGGKTPENA